MYLHKISDFESYYPIYVDEFDDEFECDKRIWF